MIKAKHDGQYKQVGFIKVRQSDGTYKDVENKYGKTSGGEYGLVFEKGFTRGVEGSLPLTLNSIGKPLKDYDIYGNTYQAEGVSSDTPQEVVGVGERTGNTFDYVKYFESTFTYCNDYFEWAEIKLNPFTTYTLSTSYPEVLVAESVTETAFIIATSTETPTTVNGGISSTRIVTKTTEADGIVKIYKRTKGVFVVKKADFDSGGDWLMINEGSTPLPYEPYGYKVDVGCRGKNLFNGEIQQGSLADINGSLVESLTRVRTTKISVSEDTTYTISSNLILRNIIAYKNDTFVAQVYDGSASAKTSVTFTIPAGANQIAVAFKGNQAGNIDITPNDFEWLMINEGSTPEPYEPYTPPIITPIYLDSPLYKIGDYADSRGMTEEVRVIKELVLTGEESWALQSINEYGMANFFIKLTDAHKITIKLICTHFIEQTTQIANTMTEGVFNANGNALYIRVNQERMNTATAFKSYLAEQYAAGTPVTVYYVLAEPESKAVDAVEIPTLDGTTVIDVDTEVKPSNMRVEYKSSK